MKNLSCPGRDTLLHSAMRVTMRVLIYGVFLVFSASCKDFKDGYEKGFKGSFLKKFISSCQSGAVEKGAAPAVAKSYCECVGKDLTQNYSSTELTRITMQGKDAPELDRAVKACTGN